MLTSAGFDNLSNTYILPAESHDLKTFLFSSHHAFYEKSTKKN